MSSPNRLELAPYFLVAADFAIIASVAVAVLPLGIAQLMAPLLVLVVVYASGEYSLLSALRARVRLGVPVACLLFMGIQAIALRLHQLSWLLSWQWGVRVAIAALGCLALAFAHYRLEGFLRARSRRFVLHLRPDMRDAAAALRRHIAHALYPAEVELDGEPGRAPDRLRADVLNPRVTIDFDPARFCDRALRVLPPAVLDLRRDYVRWEAHGRRAYDALKRFCDIAVASLFLLAGLPLMLVAAIGIVIDDGRPAFFRQVRVGRFGRRFSLLKLRTLQEHDTPGATPNDNIESRAFRFGAFLRRTRLDELPQLINVVRGDMSLIGPRPEMEFFHDRWAGVIPFYRQRLLVRPGMSGWAQVRFPHTTSEVDYLDKTAYDLWYIAHRTPWLDARIAVRTVGVVLIGFGAR